jgi:hypothetical protein
MLTRLTILRGENHLGRGVRDAAVPPESALREGSLLFTQCRRASRFTHPQLGLASVRRRAPFLAAVTIAMHGPYRDWPCIWSGVNGGVVSKGGRP